MRPVLNLKPPRRVTKALRGLLASLHALSADVRTLTPTFAAEVSNTGLPLFVYTCNTSRTVECARAAGAAAVMSDRPGWLADHLRREDATHGT
jgi:hypothetical protein